MLQRCAADCPAWGGRRRALGSCIVTFVRLQTTVKLKLGSIIHYSLERAPANPADTCRRPAAVAASPSTTHAAAAATTTPAVTQQHEDRHPIPTE